MRNSRPLHRILRQQRGCADRDIWLSQILETDPTYQQIIDAHRELTRVMSEDLILEARAKVATARKAQLVRWLGSQDVHLRAFVFEHMGKV